MIEDEYDSFLRPNQCQPAVVQRFTNKMLDEFCSTGNFLGLTQLVKGFEEEDQLATAQAVVDRMNSHQVNISLEAQHGMFDLRASFVDCPLVWDNGATYSLTIFRGDFIDYEERSIPVQHISKTTMAIRIRTVMWNTKEPISGTIYLPILCYFLPIADIRL